MTCPAINTYSLPREHIRDVACLVVPTNSHHSGDIIIVSCLITTTIILNKLLLNTINLRFNAHN